MRRLWLGIACIVAPLMLAQGCRTVVHKRGAAMMAYAGPEAVAYAEESAPASPTEGSSVQKDAIPNPSPVSRFMIYDATFVLVVEDVDGTIEKIKALTDKAGGYMQSVSDRSICVRIPAAKFNEAVRDVERFGEVASRQITGQDVTDEMHDLKIRLSNAEEVRKRLTELMNKADKVEDAIKIEQELGRVTETIELLKGKIQLFENRIAFSTLTVTLNSPLPQRVVKEEIPFAWVRELASELAKGPATDYRSRGAGEVGFDLPKSFARYAKWRDVTRATSADGVLIKVHRQENAEGADLDFWTALITRSLTIQGAVAGIQCRDAVIRDSVKTKVVEGTKEIAGQEFAYMVAIAVRKKRVYVYEAWGPLDRFTSCKPAIEDSVRTMKVLPFYLRILR